MLYLLQLLQDCPVRALWLSCRDPAGIPGISCFSSCRISLLSQMFPLLLRRAAQALLLPSLAVPHCAPGQNSASPVPGGLSYRCPNSPVRLHHRQQHGFPCSTFSPPHKHNSAVGRGRHRGATLH